MKIKGLKELLNMRKETGLFERRLKSGFYDRPKYRTFEDYQKGKLEKDTKAVEDFSKSKIFKDILTYSKGESKWV